MNKFLAVAKSRTVWTIVLLFLINGLQAIQPQLSEQNLLMVNGVLSVLAIVYRAAQKQDFKA